jgi:hypothetical protein
MIAEDQPTALYFVPSFGMIDFRSTYPLFVLSGIPVLDFTVRFSINRTAVL